MPPPDLEVTLKITPPTDEEIAAVEQDMELLERYEDLDDAAFRRAIASEACCCAGRFVCTRCKVREEMN